MASKNATLITTGKTPDDTGILEQEMLKYASVRVPLAVAFGLLPIIFSALAYVSSFSFTSQVVIGVITGLIGMFAYQLFEVHRSTVRRQKTLQVGQLSALNHDDVKRLVAEQGNFPDWAVFTDFDRVEWLNKQLSIIWPSLDKAISETLKAQLEPILNQYATGLIKKFTLKNLSLGDKGPRFDGIKVSQGEDDETVLETQFLWVAQREHLHLKVELTGPDFQVKVKDIHVAGILKFIFKPLLEQIPPFGAVLVSFAEAPDVDFNLKFLGGSIDAVPGVEKLIDNGIRTALMDTMVWPCRIVVPVAPGDWSYLELHPVAELDVTLIEAQDIMKMDVMGKSDPFCLLYVRQKADKIKRSSTKKNKKNAVWNEGFILEVEEKESQTLTVRLMDEEELEKAQYIGSAEFKLSNMKPGVSEDVWLDMVENPQSSSPEASRARVHLLIIYKPLPETDSRREAANKGKHDGGSPKKGTPNDEPRSPHLGDKPQI